MNRYTKAMPAAQRYARNTKDVAQNVGRSFQNIGRAIESAVTGTEVKWVLSRHQMRKEARADGQKHYQDYLNVQAQHAHAVDTLDVLHGHEGDKALRGFNALPPAKRDAVVAALRERGAWGDDNEIARQVSDYATNHPSKPNAPPRIEGITDIADALLAVGRGLAA